MDPITYAKYLGALAIVLGLLALVAAVAKQARLMPGSFRQSASGRLQIIDQLGLDPKRRLMIVRCDEREHLILLSADGMIELAHPLRGQGRGGPDDGIPSIDGMFAMASARPAVNIDHGETGRVIPISRP